MEPPDGRHFSLQEQQMSARKLGRLAGLVFVLAAVFGGIGIPSHVSEHEAGGTTDISAVEMANLEVIWS
jgi:hypothetical protein